MKKLIPILMVILMFSACNPIQKKVTCSECKGKGEVTYNATERMAIAKCQLYFAAHERECDKCKKHLKDESSPICRKATRKIESIMEDAKKQPPQIITEQCPICGGSGKLIEE
ncbi:MAG: hypothetical protein M0R80_08360 [Proteobacteria bacterium]|nr:hypothetical protein [Pseudomonadota bacterium]